TQLELNNEEEMNEDNYELEEIDSYKLKIETNFELQRRILVVNEDLREKWSELSTACFACGLRYLVVEFDCSIFFGILVWLTLLYLFWDPNTTCFARDSKGSQKRKTLKKFRRYGRV
ncbi:2080_t:CDS:2, partial [Funneliformis caledonium]